MATHNTHNPLTGDGVNNTHNPLTGDKTGPYPPQGTNPVTGRTRDGEFGRNEQQYGPGGPTGLDGNQTHNTHNPFTGDGVNNTHNPLTGDKTGPNPPPGTNPVTGRTKDGELGRHEQQYPVGANAAGTNGAGYTGNDTIHDSTRGAHASTGTGIGATTGTGVHPTSQQASGGGAKALVGKVEATLGNILHNPEMHAKGVQKQEEAAAAKAAKAEGAHHGTHATHGTHADPTGIPAHDHRTARENLAAEGGPAGAGAGAGQVLGGGGRAAI
ncbi:hypothetical protein RhiJN_01326 [Ceratobasidium sp. AG-Ba]|nr:hypothetical protein RhiJN_01326 [Ceratobasidium sp. AG-Ba]QRW02352.1 hypothetical protein RhiLY_01350 [Ceratobasidium sp. AG-Ba]